MVSEMALNAQDEEDGLKADNDHDGRDGEGPASRSGPSSNSLHGFQIASNKSYQPNLVDLTPAALIKGVRVVSSIYRRWATSINCVTILVAWLEGRYAQRPCLAQLSYFLGQVASRLVQGSVQLLDSECRTDVDTELPPQITMSLNVLEVVPCWTYFDHDGSENSSYHLPP